MVLGGFQWDLKLVDLCRETFNKATTRGWFIGAIVCPESSFGSKSPSPVVIVWPRCHSSYALISMETPSNCVSRPIVDSLSGLSSHTCSQKKIYSETNAVNINTHAHINKHTSPKLDRSDFYFTLGQMLSVIHPPTSV